MKILHFFIRTSLAALFVLVAFAADISGKWVATQVFEDKTFKFEYDFKIEGSTLTGTVVGPSGVTTIQDGKVDGDALTFSTEHPRTRDKAHYTCKVAGDEIKMKIDMGGRTQELVARREK